ncbi:DNA polymerase [Virgisporangium aliadipatigenens]|uniref:DNA polymerase n=1 Tax=Virgisporangium aliadipatigenens TaxID=741659 RepID=A0A8J4DUB0_9ACTN|nr:DNA polymerase Y family protein [Virgisporangium aliadipatigenens]GIJ49873.1 DNA polymerase [Virgisporangium aliadipatigenens]
MSVRTLAIWCPDWPVIAFELTEGVPATGPVAVLRNNRVLACSPAARAEGVRRGLRKREVQGRCPQVVVVEHDPGRDARAFEPVVAAVSELVPSVEVVRSGVCAVAARGPARYYGGEEPAAERLVEHIAQACGVEAQIGIADGVFAAVLAARAGRLVEPGGTAAYLSGLDVAATGRPALVELLRRLGVRTLGDFAALPAADVLARFGFDGALAHRLAAGLDDHPLRPERLPPDLDVADDFTDEPLDRVDSAAFAARALAERLHATLAGHGLACTRLGIEARTEAGEELHRVWRHDGLLTAAAIADRVRWQLDGWLTNRHRPAPGAPATSGGPTAGITRLRLIPDGIVPAGGLQLGLWGDAGENRDRADRAMTRVQGLLGPDAVRVGVPSGGRDPGERVTLVPWGDEPVPERPAEPPWPGRIPAPAPATVFPDPLPAAVYDDGGVAVAVSGRLAVSAPPAQLRIGADPPVAVAGWAGPWPIDERWWAPAEAQRAARFQFVLADGRAVLAVLARGNWSVTAVYD